MAAAQNNLSGTVQCPAQPNESHSIEVGDHPGHAHVIFKGACTWTKPLGIAEGDNINCDVEGEYTLPSK